MAVSKGKKMKRKVKDKQADEKSQHTHTSVKYAYTGNDIDITHPNASKHRTYRPKTENHASLYGNFK